LGVLLLDNETGKSLFPFIDLAPVHEPEAIEPQTLNHKHLNVYKQQIRNNCFGRYSNLTVVE
jgi:hypothetical protein